MKEFLTAGLLLLGSAFMILAALGITRMPDLYSRMQTATKAGILGIGMMMLAVAVHFSSLGVTTQALAVIAFFCLTAPVAAHMIARAAYVSKVPLWDRSVVDELKGRYDPQTHELASISKQEMSETSVDDPE